MNPEYPITWEISSRIEGTMWKSIFMSSLPSISFAAISIILMVFSKGEAAEVGITLLAISVIFFAITFSMNRDAFGRYRIDDAGITIDRKRGRFFASWDRVISFHSQAEDKGKLMRAFGFGNMLLEADATIGKAFVIKYLTQQTRSKNEFILQTKKENEKEVYTILKSRLKEDVVGDL